MDNSLRRFVYLLVSLASIVIIMLGIRTAATVINAILLAALITIAILPVAEWLVKKGWSQTMAVAGTLVVVVGVLVLLVFLTWISIGRITASLATIVATTPDSAPEAMAQEQMDNLLSQWQGLYTQADSTQVLAAVVSIVGPFITQAITVIMILVFMLSAAMTTPLAKQLEKFSSSENIDRLTSVTRDVQQYITLTTLVNVITGGVTTIFLLIAGIDFAILWGIMTWLFGYIPFIGFWIPLIPPVVLAWADYGLPMAVLVFAVIAGINAVAENYVKPRIMGEGLKVSPLIIFISLIVWGWVLGVTGALLAVPLTILITSVLDYFEGTRWITALIRTSDVKEGERSDAMNRLTGVWENAESLWRGGGNEEGKPPPKRKRSHSEGSE
jgi:predicted PurR-regulated permease PerM